MYTQGSNTKQKKLSYSGEVTNAKTISVSQYKNNRKQGLKFIDNRSDTTTQRKLQELITNHRKQNFIVQRVKVGELLKPVGKRLAAKHIYNTNFVNKPKVLKVGSKESKENMAINEFNARQVGRIGGKRKPEGTQKNTNTVFNVTVANLNDHIKQDHNQDELSGKYVIDTRSYKFASAVAGDKVMAFGGIQQGTGEIHTNSNNDSANTRYDHLQSTNPATPLDANLLGAQAGGWIVKKAEFTDKNWEILTTSRDQGFGEGNAEAGTASAAAGDLG